MNIERKTNLELHAFIDGELDAKSSQRVQVAIDSDPELAREYQAIKSLKELMKAEFVGMQAAETPTVLIDSVRDYPPVTHKTPSRAFSWAAAACLVAGVLGGYLLGSQAPNHSADSALDANWIEQVVSYHDMYTVATLEHVSSTASERHVLLERLSASMGRTLMIPEFADSSLEFKRGQILRSGGQPVIQLAYLDADTGSPVAVCITPDRQSKTQEDGQIEQGQAFELNFVNWQNNGLDFLVVGPFDADKMGEIATQVIDQFAEV